MVTAKAVTKWVRHPVPTARRYCVDARAPVAQRCARAPRPLRRRTRNRSNRLPGDGVPNLELGVHAHRASIKVLSSHIERIERKVLQSIKPRPEYQMLLTVPGIGPVIAWTIVLETGDLSRFASVGHFASYCRCVDSKRTSNEKKKGENNVKNGNAYLAWAFFEAAHFAIQYLPAAKRFYQRKSAQRNPILAIKALAHKIARACYYLMRDRVPFDAARLFA
jgi:transposase